MNKDKTNITDDLREEYDLTSLKVRKLGRNRKSFTSHIVRLDSDVAEMFPDADAVNEALRFLIRVTQQNQPTK
jgi:chaperonin cofactor prefoldin